MNILEGLNEEQVEAVKHIYGPLLVIAGAGSGKTKVITHRVAYLISQEIEPNSILAVTFTNKAAGEMRERILKLLNFKNVKHPFISTFHALGARILREDFEPAGINKNFSILDEDDGLKIIKAILKELELKEETFSANRVKNFISSQKNRLITHNDFLEEAQEYFPKIMAEVWYRYEEKLREQGLLDFDDLIVKTFFLFKSEPEILKKYQNRWKFIHIDEYQDTNRPQYALSKMLAASHNNICVVGDSDQAIYSFRGADFTNILNFNKDWENAKVVVLNKNYRSTKNILDTANVSIAHNKARHPKDLLNVKENGEPASLYVADNEIAEGEFVASKIKKILDYDITIDADLDFNKPHFKNQSIAVLLRTNFQSRIFEEFFLQAGISYEMLGIKFFERKEIKDILAYFKYALNRNDFLSFERMANSPNRGIGEKTLAKYFKKEDGISPQRKKELERLNKIADDILENIKNMPCSALIKKVFEDSGYEDYLSALNEEGEKRLENVKEVVSLAKKYDVFQGEEAILKLLEESALMSQDDNSKESENMVKITTVHAAKGLEFDIVFVVGLEEGLFPYQSFNDTDREMKIEEERRLFYVALTRAKKNLFLSCARTRTIFGEKKMNKPSRFLTEIKDEIVIL